MIIVISLSKKCKNNVNSFSHLKQTLEYKVVQDKLNIKTPGPNKIHMLYGPRWTFRATTVRLFTKNFLVLNSKQQACVMVSLIIQLKTLYFEMKT